jgi:hypothetical protein
VPFALLISNDNDADKGSDLLLSAEDELCAIVLYPNPNERELERTVYSCLV